MIWKINKAVNAIWFHSLNWYLKYYFFLFNMCSSSRWTERWGQITFWRLPLHLQWKHQQYYKYYTLYQSKTAWKYIWKIMNLLNFINLMNVCIVQKENDISWNTSNQLLKRSLSGCRRIKTELFVPPSGHFQ